MTDLLSRPIRGVTPSPSAPQRPLVVTAALAGAATAVGGIIVFVAVAVVGWFSSDVGSFAGAVRIGVTGWLFGNGGGLAIGGTTVSMMPLGSLLVFGWLLHRSGRWTGHRLQLADLRDAAAACGSLATAYAGCALIAYAGTRSGDGHAIAWRSLFVPALLAAVAGGSGVLRESGLLEPLVDRIPDEVRAVATGGLAAVAVMVAASALLFTASLVVHFSHAVTLAEGLHTGVFGGVVIALVGIAFAPNAILCAGAYLVGPGFTVGTGTEVSPSRVDLGPLPAHPLLAALPESAGAWWQSGLLLLPVAAGAVAGWVALRRFPVSGGLDRVALRGGSAGLTGGVVFGLMTGLAAGSIGPGRMQDVGPNVLATLGLCTASALVGGVVIALVHVWLARSPRVGDDSLS